MIMKLIDFDTNGHVVKLYFGAHDLKDWWGDDWNDTPYEHNAGVVYGEFVKKTLEVAFPFDFFVMEPSSGEFNSMWCKNQMKERQVPALAILKSDQNIFAYSFKDIVSNSKTLKLYFGDSEKEILKNIKRLENVKILKEEYFNFDKEVA
jgi:hypothetical protein